MAPAPSSTNSSTCQDSLDENFGSGRDGCRRSLVHGTTADLEDGEITEEESNSAVRLAATVPVGLIHEPKPPPAVDNTGIVAPLESGPVPGPAARTPTPDPASPRSCMPLLCISNATSLTEAPVSDEELDVAKSIVLDLLGWGVEPEYLIECGVSSQAIYRIFTELHLRLPTNLSYFG
jgi:hypothetical protein